MELFEWRHDNSKGPVIVVFSDFSGARVVGNYLMCFQSENPFQISFASLSTMSKQEPTPDWLNLFFYMSKHELMIILIEVAF